MAYNDTPLPTNLISDSQPDIRENFQLLEDSQVVDEGSTNDGDYIRYENGWQICFGYEDTTQTTDETSFGSNFHRTTATTLEFPINFSSTPLAKGIFDVGSDYNAWASETDVTTERVRVFGIATDDTTTGTRGYFAIGRWK